jgi:hypothetical protein
VNQAQPEPSDVPGWVVVGLLTACAVLSGVLEVLFIPFYIGASLVPVVVIFAVAGNVLFPLWCYREVPAAGAAALPFAAWVLPVLVLPLYPRAEGDVLVLGGNGQQWTFYGVVLLGCGAGFATIVRVTGPNRGPGRTARRRVNR